jgi:hypothetical protein
MSVPESAPRFARRPPTLNSLWLQFGAHPGFEVDLENHTDTRRIELVLFAAAGIQCGEVARLQTRIGAGGWGA